MERGQQEGMYQSNYSSYGSRMGSAASPPRSPHEQSPPKQKGALRDKLEHLVEDLRVVIDDVNYHKKDLQILRGQKEHLENVLGMKAVDVRKNLANEVVKGMYLKT